MDPAHAEWATDRRGVSAVTRGKCGNDQSRPPAALEFASAHGRGADPRALRGDPEAAALERLSRIHPAAPLRFVDKGLASRRQRLGLSAAELGRMFGVSGQTVYLWESGRARPRPGHMPAIAALRSLGRRQAAAVLASRP